MTADTDQTDLLRTTIELARHGGRIAADRVGQARTARKADSTFITQVDFEIQDALLAAIADRYPGHAVLAEEELAHPERHAPVDRATICWVIDPLDGTRNFSRAVPVFSTSVAVLRDGEPIAAAVCDAMTGQTFAASLGGGATLDGETMAVRDIPANPDTMITVRGRSGHPAPAVMHHWVDSFSLRNFGSAALHMAFVAAGMIDAAYHQQCKLWDLAAGFLLVTEAGGVTTSTSGRPLFPRRLTEYDEDDLGFLAAGPGLHARLLGDIQKHS